MLSLIEKYHKDGNHDFAFISSETGFTRQQVRNYFLKLDKSLSLKVDYRGMKPKLGQDHLHFITNYFNNQNNFGNTVSDLHRDLIIEFGLEKNYISTRSLYNYLEEIGFSNKKIIYKISTANTERIKQQRKKVALEILSHHLSSFEFIYLDEISFNLEFRPVNGWAPIGKKIETSKPCKSKNYSTIVCMDIHGPIGIKIIKGGGGLNPAILFCISWSLSNMKLIDFKTKKLFC